MKNCLACKTDGNFVTFFLIINKSYFKKPRAREPMKSDQYLFAGMVLKDLRIF